MKFDGGLMSLHEADDGEANWLNNMAMTTFVK